MRRALRDTVPSLVLNRRRKAYASRNPLAAIVSLCESLMAENARWASARLGIVDQKAAIAAVEKAQSGENLPLFQLSRTLSLESWLRGFTVGPQMNPAVYPCAPNPQYEPPAAMPAQKEGTNLLGGQGSSRLTRETCLVFSAEKIHVERR
jgi:hypothetical protein